MIDDPKTDKPDDETGVLREDDVRTSDRLDDRISEADDLPGEDE